VVTSAFLVEDNLNIFRNVGSFSKKLHGLVLKIDGGTRKRFTNNVNRNLNVNLFTLEDGH
jgi:hypothetical protein